MHGVRVKHGLGPDLSRPSPPAVPLLRASWLPRGTAPRQGSQILDLQGRCKPKPSEASSASSVEHSGLDRAAFPFLPPCEFLAVRGQVQKNLYGEGVRNGCVCVTMCGDIVGPQGGQSRDQKGLPSVPLELWPPPYVN